MKRAAAAAAAVVMLAACFDKPPKPSGIPPGGVDGPHRLAAGGNHACWIDDSARMFCWGANTYGELGVSTIAVRASGMPQLVVDPTTGDPIDGWIDVAAGGAHTCGLLTTGVILCFGANYFGQSQGTSRINTIDLPTTATRVFAGDDGSCAIDTKGQLYCWGAVPTGPLAGALATPTQLSPGGVDAPWGTVATSGSHACARRSDDGTVWCWGANEHDQLGAADGTPRDVAGANSVDGGPYQTIATTTADLAGCAIASSGALACWGEGIVTLTAADSPLQVVDDPSTTHHTWTAVALDDFHVCGIADRTLYCYGADNAGALGNGFTSDETPPHHELLGNAVEVAVGAAFTCASDSSGAVRCWGTNTYGQLGNGQIAGVNQPAKILAGPVSEIAVGLGHTCALLDTGDLWCWGDNRAGQVDPADTQMFVTTPHMVVSGVAHVATGARHTCSNSSVSPQTAVTCWGDQPGPVDLSMFGAPTMMVGGGGEVCAIASGSGYAFCWGTGLDDGTTVPHAVATGAANAIGVAVGDSFGAVLDASGTGYTAWGWGEDCSQTAPTSPAPGLDEFAFVVATGTPAAVAAISQGGSGHGCLATNAGEIECWGANDHHQVSLANTSCISSSAPALVTGVTWRSPPELAVGGDHSCAVDTNQFMYCWGDNPDFVLTDDVGGGDVATPAPVAHKMGLSWDHIATGPGHTCAITSSASGADLYCWGANQFGEVGTGASWVPTPPTTQPISFPPL